MRSLSIWAKHHRGYAICILIAAKILLVFTAVKLGRILASLDVRISPSVFYLSIFMFLAAALAYPGIISGTRDRKQNYGRRKACDLMLALCTFAICTTLVNTDLRVLEPQRSSATNIVKPTAEEILASLAHRDKSTLTKKEKRILKNEFKKQLKVYAKAKITGKKKEAEKSLLVILTIIAAVGLIFLVGALACGLACNGAEGAATVILILGVAGVVLGTIFVIRAIYKKDRRRKEFSPKPDTST